MVESHRPKEITVVIISLFRLYRLFISWLAVGKNVNNLWRVVPQSNVSVWFVKTNVLLLPLSRFRYEIFVHLLMNWIERSYSVDGSKLIKKNLVDTALIDLPQTVSRQDRPISFSELAFDWKATYRLICWRLSLQQSKRYWINDFFALSSLTEIRATKNYDGPVIVPRAWLFYSGH